MALPKIRGTQIGLRKPELVERLKEDMIADRYVFTEGRGQIGGVVDAVGTYHVVEGHHRMAAALEIFQETGDERAALSLIEHGRWSQVMRAPAESRPFPSRTWWGAFRNWLGW
jgi:hypothetical protein